MVLISPSSDGLWRVAFYQRDGRRLRRWTTVWCEWSEVLAVMRERPQL
jgi:hypothetical protein